MSGQLYQVLGTGVPPMLGRKKVVQDILGRLTKPSPDHVQVVGPELYGKSVLLQHLPSKLAGPAGPYAATLYWDLRHHTPRSDAEFTRAFVSKLRTQVMPFDPTVARYLDPDGNALDDLQLAFEELETNGHRILVILDGFDYVLRSTGITRNLWDQLRDLGQHRGLRYVTGSRAPLREICKPDEAQTSDFWNIFSTTPVVVAAFDDEDLVAFCEPIERLGVNIEPSARKELANWTGGIPLLAAAMLQRLHQAAKGGTSLDGARMEAVAHEVLEEERVVLDQLFSDFTLEMQIILIQLTRGDLAASSVPNPIVRGLVQRGFVREAGSRLRFANEIMKRHITSESGGLEDLRRQFGEEASYKENIRVVLQLRLAQARGADPELKAAVERAVRELPDLPGVLISMRRISDRAMALIWNKELPDGRNLPSEWTDEWDREGATQRYPYDKRVPRERGAQVGLLALATGTRGPDRVARFVSTYTALLVSHIHAVGDVGQHQEGRGALRLSAVIAACWSAVELCHSLTADLRGTVQADARE